MFSPKPRYWNQAVLANYLGGTEDDVSNVRRALTKLMKAHGKLNKNYKSKVAKTGLKSFLISNLDQLPRLVHDVSSNPVRMDGLMGLAYKVNNGHKQYGRDKVASLVTNTPPDHSDYGDEDSGEEDSDNEANAGTGTEVNKASDGQPRPPETDGTAGDDSVHDNGGVHDARSDHSGTSDIRANDSSPAAVMDDHNAKEPPSKRIRTIPPSLPPLPPQPPQHEHQYQHQHQHQHQHEPQPKPQPPGFNLLARNIWVVNEVNPQSHGLCPTLELVTKSNPQIADLDFDHWISIVQAQCGYDYTVHRLEYRPSPTIVLSSMSRPITVPMQTLSQWRGALNSQLQAKPDQDPVFYMVFPSQSRPEPSCPPAKSPIPLSEYDHSQARQPVTSFSPTVKQEFVEELVAQPNNTR